MYINLLCIVLRTSPFSVRNIMLNGGDNSLSVDPHFNTNSDILGRSFM